MPTLWAAPFVCPRPRTLLPAPILSPLPRLLRGEGRNQKAPGCGALFHFIQVPLKRSLYKSAHEDAQETPAGLHGRWRMLRSANVHIYREPPEKNKGETEIPGMATTSPDTTAAELKKEGGKDARNTVPWLKTIADFAGLHIVVGKSQNRV